MSILIKGMKMPKEGVIVLKIDKNGDVCTTARNDYKKYNAIELPPHGDLIDREKISFVEAEYACDDYAFRYDINEMTPVIPADPEGGDSNG